MKLGYFLIALILLVGSVSALSTDLEDSYSRGENIIIKIQGNILEPITPESVEFLREGHIRVPLDQDVKRLGDDYYIWAIAPNPEEDTNYTLSIEGVKTTENAQHVEIDYLENFEVTGDLVNYNIKPGFIFAKDDFSVNIFSNKDEDISIEVGGKSLNLEPGANSIEFSVDDFVGAKLNLLSIGDYVMPAYVIGKRSGGIKTDVEVNTTDSNETIDLEDNDAIEIEAEISNEEVDVQYYCSEISGGEKCAASEFCDGEKVSGLDGSCCVGSCSEVAEEDSNISIAVIIFIVVMLIILFLWWRYRKARRVENPLVEKVGRIEDAKGTP